MKTTTSTVYLRIGKTNYYRNMVWLTIAAFVIGNTIFGWHREAQSTAEHIFDNIVGAMFIISFLGYMMAEALQYVLSKARIEITQKHFEGCDMCEKNIHHHCTHVFPNQRRG